jgi:hypothetical protein
LTTFRCHRAHRGLRATVDRGRGDPETDGFSERWNVPPGPNVPVLVLRFHVEIAHTLIGHPMNIFYIIGVVVVVIIVASFLGLHV